MKCVYCDGEGAHPGTKACVSYAECRLRVTQQELAAAVAALRALIGQVKRANHGLHTAGCATHPREIVLKARDRSPDGYDEPQYTEPGKCDCGAVEVVAQVDAVLKEAA